MISPSAKYLKVLKVAASSFLVRKADTHTFVSITA